MVHSIEKSYSQHCRIGSIFDFEQQQLDMPKQHILSMYIISIFKLLAVFINIFPLLPFITYNPYRNYRNYTINIFFCQQKSSIFIYLFYISQTIMFLIVFFLYFFFNIIYRFFKSFYFYMILFRIIP